jgi:hypothetical protein
MKLTFTPESLAGYLSYMHRAGAKGIPLAAAIEALELLGEEPKPIFTPTPEATAYSQSKVAWTKPKPPAAPSPDSTHKFGGRQFDKSGPLLEYLKSRGAKGASVEQIAKATGRTKMAMYTWLRHAVEKRRDIKRIENGVYAYESTEAAAVSEKQEPPLGVPAKGFYNTAEQVIAFLKIRGKKGATPRQIARACDRSLPAINTWLSDQLTKGATDFHRVKKGLYAYVEGGHRLEAKPTTHAPTPPILPAWHPTSLAVEKIAEPELEAQAPAAPEPAAPEPPKRGELGEEIVKHLAGFGGAGVHMNKIATALGVPFATVSTWYYQKGRTHPNVGKLGAATLAFKQTAVTVKHSDPKSIAEGATKFLRNFRDGAHMHEIAKALGMTTKHFKGWYYKNCREFPEIKKIDSSTFVYEPQTRIY